MATASGSTACHLSNLYFVCFLFQIFSRLLLLFVLNGVAASALVELLSTASLVNHLRLQGPQNSDILMKTYGLTTALSVRSAALSSLGLPFSVTRTESQEYFTKCLILAAVYADCYCFSHRKCLLSKHTVTCTCRQKKHA